MQIQVAKNRNVSEHSPFDKKNSPPAGYLVPEKVTIKPTKINPQEVDTKETPLAGHLTEIGEKILKLGARKAVHVTTMDWGIGAARTS
jgi:hypothetical protein